MNNFFYSNFTVLDSDAEPPPINTFVNPELSNLVLTTAEIRLILCTLNANKATGPDSLSAKLLKECAAELAPSLTALFNLSLSLSTVPDQWKAAHVTPVFKKGDKELCCNYRPISLLCIISKVLERAILTHIYDQIKPLITKAQHGFLRGRSTATQLISFYNNVNTSLDSSIQTDTIFLDFSKAFDSVPHTLLAHKLQSFGICENLLAWFTSYLSNRTQRVVIEGQHSEWLPVLSGVPQGSILGPFLFLLYTNDIGDRLSTNTTISLFADDAKISRPIYSFQDCETLQSDLFALELWSDTWLLQFNTLKCKILSFCRTLRYSYDYQLRNEPLERVYQFKDLGVIVTSNLSWKPHVQCIVSKANRLLGLIRRTLGPLAPLKSKLLLYLSLVRSTLMYASVVWKPDKGDLVLLEGVQRRASKFILNDYTSEYKTRLTRIGIIPLSYLREQNDLCFLYKCLHRYYDFDIFSYVQLCEPTATNTRSNSEPLRLKPHTFKTELAASFFTHRIIDSWNALPPSVRTITPQNRLIYTFKLQLKCLLKTVFNARFSVADTCTWMLRCRCRTCRS